MSFVGGVRTGGRGERFQAKNPMTGEALPPTYGSIDSKQLSEATDMAVAALAEPLLGDDTLEQALLLCAESFSENSAEIVQRARAETALGESRLETELQRTIRQFDLFGRSRSDDPLRRPLVDSPDGLRIGRVPLGVVAVFAASNFPLAFGVAGTDTTSALAAGCPVIAKAHPLHPGAAELCGEIVVDCLRRAGAHPGFFSLVHEAGTAIGTELVMHPDVDAVAFTGSLAGGSALYEAASQRPRPIPVFAEMGSINPVFLSQRAVAKDPHALAEGIVGSYLLSEGQFCTKPGLIFLPAGAASESLIEALKQSLTERDPHPLLDSRFADAVEAYLDELGGHPGVAISRAGGEAACPAALIQTDWETVLSNDLLKQERFGPVTVVATTPESEMAAVATRLEGSLTGTIHFEPGDEDWARQMIETLARRVGRIIANGFPTGVRVSTAMHHGGPFPATTASQYTSVGARAVDRFLRPVCLQDMPADLVPDWARVS